MLINNAGMSYGAPSTDINIDKVKELFDANVFGVMRMCQAFAPLLIKANGAIVQIGSITAKMYVLTSKMRFRFADINTALSCLEVGRGRIPSCGAC
jgi:short-subunit dehydrogenase